eukprot:scaffold2192_cov268-Chaetoceros_neogracile.AAC.114
MTTAHRPTWKAAVGKSNEGGWTAGGAGSTMRSALSLPGHTKLKTRRDQEFISKEREEILKQSLKKLRDMEERTLGPRVMDEHVEQEGRQKMLMSTADIDDEEMKKKYDDADNDDEGKANENGWSDVEDVLNDDSDLDSDSDDDSDSDSDDEDEEAALQAELAKIRAEREIVKAKEEAEEAANEQEHMEEAALVGNPLLSSGGDDTYATGKQKRRWNEDVVFRNQAKGEPGQKKRFINDTIRNDFHKRFLNKFIK